MRESKQLYKKRELVDSGGFKPSTLSSNKNNLLRQSGSNMSMGLFLNETPQKPSRFSQVPTEQLQIAS
jgi:hypothetical protein